MLEVVPLVISSFVRIRRKWFVAKVQQAISAARVPWAAFNGHSY